MTTSKLPSLIGMRSISKVVSSVIGGILSIEARDIDTKLLSAPESNNALAKCWFRRNTPIASSGWPFVFAVSGQMTHLVRGLTLDSARSCVMQSAFLSQGKASSIPTVFSWGGSISSESFPLSIMLLAVIIVAVAIVVTVILVVIDAIIGVVVVVSCVPSIIKLSFVIIGWAYVFHQDKASSVKVPVANVTLFSSAQLLRENTDSVRSNQRMRPTAPSVPLKYKG
ncbi:hypothetical protein Tco_0476338 [Tanacetum coccineum]